MKPIFETTHPTTKNRLVVNTADVGIDKRTTYSVSFYDAENTIKECSFGLSIEDICKELDSWHKCGGEI